MKIQEVVQKWNAANEIDEFTKFQLAEMLDSAVQHIEQQNAAEQSVHPTGYQTAIIPCPHCGVNITIDNVGNA